MNERDPKVIKSLLQSNRGVLRSNDQAEISFFLCYRFPKNINEGVEGLNLRYDEGVLRHDENVAITSGSLRHGEVR